MASLEYKELKQGLPKPPQQLIDFIHEVFGDEVPRFIREEWEEEAQKRGMEKGMEKGMEIGRKQEKEMIDRTFTLKTIQKFRDWSDAEVADFVGVTVEYVQRLRSELAENK